MQDFDSCCPDHVNLPDGKMIVIFTHLVTVIQV